MNIGWQLSQAEVTNMFSATPTPAFVYYVYCYVDFIVKWFIQRSTIKKTTIGTCRKRS